MSICPRTVNFMIVLLYFPYIFISSFHICPNGSNTRRNNALPRTRTLVQLWVESRPNLHICHLKPFTALFLLCRKMHLIIIKHRKGRKLNNNSTMKFQIVRSRFWTDIIITVYFYWSCNCLSRNVPRVV